MARGHPENGCRSSQLAAWTNGYRLTVDAQLVIWPGPAIFEARTGADYVDTNDRRFARQAQLLRRFDNWTEITACLFAVWCARMALKLLEHPNLASIEACDVAERYARREATRDELHAACYGAWENARIADWPSGWDAREAAAWPTRWDAAENAGRAAAYWATRAAFTAVQRPPAWNGPWDAAQGAAMCAAFAAGYAALKASAEADAWAALESTAKAAAWAAVQPAAEAAARDAQYAQLTYMLEEQSA